MKTYLYDVSLFETFNEYTFVKVQKRLFIPGKGVIGFFERDKIDFFTNDAQIVVEAQNILSGKKGGRFLGELDVPETEMLNIIQLGKKLNDTKKELRTAFRVLSESLCEDKTN